MCIGIDGCEEGPKEYVLPCGMEEHTGVQFCFLFVHVQVSRGKTLAIETDRLLGLKVPLSFMVLQC
jgi:hypothetical protein